ncbi:hypothetical protein IQ268_27705 [Oculatella sp. LEGE 06141]|uniref:hypothetical protein n=2 Tax=Oculatella sp. LEGE 06141 TaxID=1828648 RepID=UPI00187E7832|nr:hypothetical protein [Oculatella sp. LEGE 06141]MBE9182337.1 hypothetical protein [Oculatella sp. LEGE 06141]
MPRRFLLWIATLSLIVVLAFSQVAQGQMGRSPGMMRHPGMRHGRDAQTIHQLFTYHDQIYRTVEEIPGGIRAVTESDNPEVAALIQSHVSQMYDRIAARQSIPMMGMSSTLSTMAQSENQYERQLRLTSKGIEVIETSDHPEMVAVIREHAQEVTQFAEQGMPAMMNGRMR